MCKNLLFFIDVNKTFDGTCPIQQFYKVRLFQKHPDKHKNSFDRKCFAEVLNLITLKVLTPLSIAQSQPTHTHSIRNQAIGFSFKDPSSGL
jgi:hypothetical protein